MKALVYHGPGLRGWDSVPDPTIIDPTDIVVRIDLLHDLRHRPAHPQGRRARDRRRARCSDTRPWARWQEVGAERRHTSKSATACCLSCVSAVRALPLLPGEPLRPVPRRRRLDLRAHDRRPPGRVRARAVRRQLHLQGARRADRRAGPVPGRHPPDRLRGRRAQRHGRAGRHRRDRRRRADRPGRDPDREASTRPGGSSRSTSTTAGWRARARFGADTTINNGREDALAQVMELTDGLGADVAIRGGRHAGDVRAERPS